MGFNFNAVREVNGILRPENKYDQFPGSPPTTHARNCAEGKVSICMCRCGIDTAGCSGDQDFYYALGEIPHERRILWDHSYFRPTDFPAARELARRITECPERLLEIIDVLERNPSVWLGGGS